MSLNCAMVSQPIASKNFLSCFLSARLANNSINLSGFSLKVSSKIITWEMMILLLRSISSSLAFGELFCLTKLIVNSFSLSYVSCPILFLMWSVMTWLVIKLWRSFRFSSSYALFISCCTNAFKVMLVISFSVLRSFLMRFFSASCSFRYKYRFIFNSCSSSSCLNLVKLSNL